MERSATGPSLKVYRLLLAAFPRAFRERYGVLMEAAFLADRRYRRGELRFWWLIFRDTLGSAAAERARAVDPTRQRSLYPNLPKSPKKAPIEMISDLFRELRYAVRTLLRSPSYAGIAVAVLAIGIGANTVVFTIVSSLFFSAPPAISDPGSLVRVTRTDENSRAVALTYPDFLLIRERNRTLADLAAYEAGGWATTLARPGSSQRVSAMAGLVTANYFDVLGVRMGRGRGFAADDDRIPREGAVVVLAEAFWRVSLGADEGIVGSAITLNGHPFTVIGVAARGFGAASPLETPPDLWVPVSMQPVLAGMDDDDYLERKGGRVFNWLYALGRLPAGVAIDQVQADLDAVNAYIEENFGDWNSGQGTAVHRSFMYQPDQRAELVGFTRLLAAVVGLVLLIVCANIAILQLARTSRRRREIGIRAALGARRAAVFRHLIVESVVLSLAGAMLGFVLAMSLSRAAAGLIPVQFSIDFRPDLRVLGFSVLLAVATALVFGLVPALLASGTDVVQALRTGGIGSGRSRLRSALVVTQVALSLILVTGAALFGRSLIIAQGVDTGFATSRRTFATVVPSNHGYGAEAGDLLGLEILGRLRATPQVESASLMVMSPFRGRWSSTLSPFGEGAREAVEVRSYINWVAPGYFATMGIPVLDGRDFGVADGRENESVLIVNRAAAELLWPSESPIGKRIAFQGDEPVDRVVGLVGDTNYTSLGEAPQPIIYMPILQGPAFPLTFVAAARGDGVPLGPIMQRAILDVDPDLAITGVSTIEQLLETQVGTYQLGARATGVLGVLAAVLAAIGLYGVLSYLVSAEQREIGIRMALGATTGGVTSGVVRHGMRLAGLGVLLGVGLALLLARAIASMLYEVSPHDPASFVLVSVVLLGVAGAASLLPARRAARVDPMEALRAD